MGIRESLLNTITSVADSDFVRIVTSAGASSKATVQNLFKSFESNLSAKSSLTTSDYIRVVGSDNNAYKQSVGNVKSAMGIDTLSSNLEGQYVSAWRPVPNKVAINSLYYCKRAGIVFVKIYDNDTLSLPAGTWTVIGTLPAGFRPTMTIAASGTTRGSRSYEIQITEDGDIYFQPTTNRGFISAMVSFPVPF